MKGAQGAVRKTRRSSTSPRTRLRIKLQSEEELARILELENRLSETGLEVDTGFSIGEGVREWDFEAGPERTRQVLQMLADTGLRAEVAKLKEPRRKRVKYKEGDVFRIPLAQGRSAYGRILIIKPSRHVFVEVYRATNGRDPQIAELARSDWLLKIYCLDNGIASGNWEIVGHSPLLKPVEMPLFWSDNLFDGKFYLRKDPVVSLGQRETTPQEIVRLRAQPAVLVPPESIEIALTQTLVEGRNHEWFQPELSRNPLRDRSKFLRRGV